MCVLHTIYEASRSVNLGRSITVSFEEPPTYKSLEKERIMHEWDSFSVCMNNFYFHREFFAEMNL